MRKKSLLIAVGVAVALLGTAARSENLLEVYQAAVRSDPLIREAEARRMAALEAKPQARGAAVAAGLGERQHLYGQRGHRRLPASVP